MAEIEVGQEAPDFTLPSVVGEENGTFTLSDHRGKNVVLVFFPLAFTPVCTLEMPSFDALLDRFGEQDATVVGISVDSSPAQIAWQKHSIGTLRYPLLSDFFPHGEVAEKFGLRREGPPIPGIAQRAIIIIDKEGNVAWKKVYELGDQPDPKEALEALAGLSS